VFYCCTRVRNRLDDAALLWPAKLIEMTVAPSRSRATSVALSRWPPLRAIATLEGTVRDKLRECGAGLTLGTELFDCLLLSARRVIASMIFFSTGVNAARLSRSGGVASRYAIRDSTRATAGITLR